ncbi:MAG TPA: crosslink repair DNA glycosylase YcaQ family protein [Dehalococcoidia bacterium]|nr:crosslink repair DNA glycosylase YcaQ family protein [Dehalococcoidia bacterium]
MLRRLGAVQLDTISVLARSHELVAYARLGPVPRAALEAAYWGQPARAFEYTAHAACIMPVALWPFFAFRRRAARERERGRSRLSPSFVEEVRARLRDGPITTTDVGGARESAGWWNWSDAKVALEGLYRRGEVVVTTRRGWKRVYDLPERAIPADLLAHEPADQECYLELVKVAARALGVGTARDIAGYFFLTLPYAGTAPNARRLVAEAIEAAGLVPVRVEGWREAAFASPAALSAPPPHPSRTTLLSPFDPLVWATPAPGQMQEREYPRRVFDFSYSFEAYVPREKRRHGYFTMPLLAGDRLVGRIDPFRRGKTLVAQRVSLEGPEAVPAAAAALREAAAWVGCTDIEVQEALPEPLLTDLVSHL